ncbi:MAG: nucleotidyltransferase family protein [Eubacterium sp.]|nr:nucleotidyltransferase family protein [Eubacterium sp.]
MKVCGIIAEYNPFHNGHQYHIEETRRRTGADYCIVIMSGDFLQRGGPAVVDKYLRAECALENGADLVIQMPVTGSTASAGEYAKCGVTLLSRLGVVTDLSFGCEAETDEEKEILFEAAGYLYTEPDCFQTILSEGMRRGMTFPAARLEALHACFGDDDRKKQILEEQLRTPNNILALEYLHANMGLDRPMTPCMITRAGASYHDEDLSENDRFPSATALRNRLFEMFETADGSTNSFDRLTEYMPASSLDRLKDYLSGHRPLSEDAFSDMLFHTLLSQKDVLNRNYPQNEELNNTIRNHLETFPGWSRFALDCKGKNQTLTSVNRHLTHILLGIDDTMIASAKTYDLAPYARILGFRRDAAPLLPEIESNASLRVITHPAGSLREMNENEQALFRLDLLAGELYSYAAKKNTDGLISELRHPLVYL